MPALVPARYFMPSRPGIVLFVASVLAAGSFTAGARAQFAPPFQVHAPYAVLLDFESGSVLYEKNADQPWPPASLAKLMTMEIVFNEIKEGTLKLEDEIIISANAWRRGGAPSRGSAMFAAVHSRVKVVDLLQGAIVQSGNDACIALAESIAGNESAFARLMTARAKELGLTSAEFRNSTGLADPDQEISVRDLAKLARHIILTYPEHLHYFGQKEFTWNKIRQENRNPLLGLNIGADGMKTGYIKESGYGLVGTAKQEGARLIVVVNGVESPNARANEAKKLLEWGFRSFDSRVLFEEGETVTEARVFGGERGRVPLVGDGVIRLKSLRGASDRFLARVYYNSPLRAPVTKGTEVGRLKILRGAQVALDLPLYAGADVGRGNLVQRATDGATEFVIGLVRSAVASVLKK